ncbi:hypothetical protein [Amycolatopsis sp. NPDC051371]|uniref:hypothetical protein n=1 Tax=Amycolatopsis sp. NPDC051371 TaxID=3155800 RepID=UPI003432C402
MSESSRFGLGRVTELDRKLAATEIEHARSTGAYDGGEAARRLAHVRRAATRAALRAAVAGGAGTAPPPALEAAPRIAGALWAAVSAANFVIWLFIGLIGGQWDPLWLIWVVLGGGVLAVGVWGARDRDRRMRTASESAP